MKKLYIIGFGLGLLFDVVTGNLVGQTAVMLLVVLFVCRFGLSLFRL